MVHTIPTEVARPTLLLFRIMSPASTWRWWKVVGEYNIIVLLVQNLKFLCWQSSVTIHSFLQ